MMNVSQDGRLSESLADVATELVDYIQFNEK